MQRSASVTLLCCISTHASVSIADIKAHTFDITFHCFGNVSNITIAFFGNQSVLRSLGSSVEQIWIASLNQVWIIKELPLPSTSENKKFIIYKEQSKYSYTKNKTIKANSG